MRRYTLELLIGRLALLLILAGMVLITGVYRGSVNTKAFTFLTVWNAILAFVFLLLENQYVKKRGRGVISKEWQFMILLSMLGVMIIGFAFMEPVFRTYEKMDYYGLFILQRVLPVVMVVHYLVGPHHHFEVKTVFYGLVYVGIYMGTAVLAGNNGVNFSFGSAKYPNPFLNVDQLGLGMVGANVLLLLIFAFVFGCVLVFIDSLGGRKHDS